MIDVKDLDSRFLKLLKIEFPEDYKNLLKWLYNEEDINRKIKGLKKEWEKFKENNIVNYGKALARYYSEYGTKIPGEYVVKDLAATGKSSRRLNIEEYNELSRLLPITGVHNTTEDMYNYGAHWYENIEIGVWK